MVNLGGKVIKNIVGLTAGLTFLGASILACRGTPAPAQQPVINHNYYCSTAAAPCPLPENTPTPAYIMPSSATPSLDELMLKGLLACSDIRSTEEASYGQYLPTPMSRMYAVPPYNLETETDRLIMDSFYNTLTKQEVIEKYFNGEWKNAIVPCDIDVTVDNHRYHVVERWLSYNPKTDVVSVTDLLESCIAYCPPLTTCTPIPSPTGTPYVPTKTSTPTSTLTPTPTPTDEPPIIVTVPINTAVPTDDPNKPHPTPTP